MIDKYFDNIVFQLCQIHDLYFFQNNIKKFSNSHSSKGMMNCNKYKARLCYNLPLQNHFIHSFNELIPLYTLLIKPLGFPLIEITTPVINWTYS